MPIHEDAIGKLEELLPDSTSPSCAYSFFISQNWEGGSPRTQYERQLPSTTSRSLHHPDNSQNSKLRWLQQLTQHMRLPNCRELWIWFDIISIPQHSRDLQKVAVSSLCCYTQLCTRFIPLVRDATAWTALYNEPENTLPSGTLQVYCKRGWCRLEVLAALTPKRFWRGDWRPGPRNIRFRYHTDPRAPGVGPLVKASEVGSPMTGDFTVADDVAMIAPIIVSIANRFAEYEASGSTAWDPTMNVSERPDWLKKLANREFEVTRRVSFTTFGRGQTESKLQTTPEPDDAMANSKPSEENDSVSDRCTIDVEQQKTSSVDSTLPEMQEHTELSELSVTGIDDDDDALQQNGNPKVDLTTHGNKSSKKNQVYVAPAEDLDFHEA